MQPLNKFFAIAAVAVLALATACNVRTEKSASGEKKVEINVPFANVKVATDVDAKDTGISGYPGARAKESGGNDKHRANVQIGGEDFGVKVIAVTYLSDDAPDKVIGFYRNDLKRYGKVLECPKGIKENKKNDEDGEIQCSDSGHEQPGKLDLAVGIPSRQHLVSVKPNGSGTEFSLVYINLRGNQTM